MKDIDYMCHRDRRTFEKVQRILGEDEVKRRQVVKEVREWLLQQPHLRARTDEHVLTLFARGCKYDVEKIKNKIEKNLIVKASMPSLFTGWDPMSPNLQAALRAGTFLPLPGYDDEHRKVFVLRPDNYDDTKLKKIDIEKANLIVGLMSGEIHEEFCCHQVVMLYDWDSFSFSRLTTENMRLGQKMLQYYQEGYPMQPKVVVHVNTSRLLSYMFSLTRPLLKEKIKKRMTDVGRDLNLLQEYIPRRMLPVDYGGDGPSLEKIAAKWKKLCEDNRQWIIDQEVFKADESKRPTESKKGWFGGN